MTDEDEEDIVRPLDEAGDPPQPAPRAPVAPPIEPPSRPRPQAQRQPAQPAPQPTVGPLDDPGRFRAEELAGPTARRVFNSDREAAIQARGSRAGARARASDIVGANPDLTEAIDDAHNAAMEQAYREMGRPFYRDTRGRIQPQQPDAAWAHSRAEGKRDEKRKERDEDLKQQRDLIDLELGSLSRAVLPTSDRKAKEEAAQAARERLLTAAENRLVENEEYGQRTGLFGWGGETDEARALAEERQRLERMRLGEIEPAEEELAAMAEADPEAAALYQETRAALEADTENHAWAAAQRERQRVIDLERHGADGLAILDAERLANATPEELRAEADTMAEDLAGLGATLERRRQAIEATQAALQAEWDAATSAEQERLQRGVTADQLVDYEGRRMTAEGAQTIIDLRAKQARAVEWMGQEQGALEADAELFNQGATRWNARRDYLEEIERKRVEEFEAERAAQLEAMRQDPRLAPLADTLEQLDAAMAKEVERARTLPPGQQQEALDAIVERFSAQSEAAQKEAAEAAHAAAVERDRQMWAASEIWQSVVANASANDYASFGPGAIPYAAVNPRQGEIERGREDLVVQRVMASTGLDEQGAKNLIDDGRKRYDWSSDADNKHGANARILSTGEVEIRPDLYFNPQQAQIELRRAGATTEQVERFNADLHHKQRSVARVFIETLGQEHGEQWVEGILRPVTQALDPSLSKKLREYREQPRSDGRIGDNADELTALVADHLKNRGWWRGLNENAKVAVGAGLAQLGSAFLGDGAANLERLGRWTGNEWIQRQVEEYAQNGPPMEEWSMASQFTPVGAGGRFGMDVTTGLVSLVPTIGGGMAGGATRGLNKTLQTTAARALPGITRSGTRLQRALAGASTPAQQKLVIDKFFAAVPSGSGGVIAGAYMQSKGMAFQEAFQHHLDQGLDPMHAAERANLQSIGPAVGTAATVVFAPLRGAEAVLRGGAGAASQTAGEVMRRMTRDGFRRSFQDPKFRQLVEAIGKDLGVEGLFEMAQEGADEFQQGMWAKLQGVRPDAKWSDVLGEALYGSLLGLVLGGGVPAAGAVRSAVTGRQQGRAERGRWTAARADVAKVADPAQRSRAEALWYVAQGQVDMLSPEQMADLGIEARREPGGRTIQREGDVPVTGWQGTAPEPGVEAVSMGFRRTVGRNPNQRLLQFGRDGEVMLSPQGGVELAAVSPEAARFFEGSLPPDSRSVLRQARMADASQRIEGWQPDPEAELSEADVKATKARARAVLMAAADAIPNAPNEVLAAVGLSRNPDGSITGGGKGIDIHQGEIVVADSLVAELREQGLGAVANLIPSSEASRRAEIDQRMAERAADAVQGGGAPAAAWTAVGRDGTRVSIPANEATSQEQAIAKLAARLPEGEMLDVESVMPPAGAATAEGGTPSAGPPSEINQAKAMVREAVDSLLADMPKLRDRFEVYETFEEAPQNMSASGADEFSGKVRVVVEGLASNSLNLAPEGRGEYLGAALDEEVKHLGDTEAARMIHKVSKDPRPFEEWAGEYYRKLWDEGFTEEQREWVRDAYGGVLARDRGKEVGEVDPQQLVREGIRMILQSRADGGITESSILGMISEALAKHLRAVIAAIRAFATGGELPPSLRDHVSQVESVVKGWRDRHSRSATGAESKVVGQPVDIERPGKPVTLPTPDQSESITGTVAGIDLAQIVTSADARYPDPRIQPRDRTSQQSAAQAATMASNLGKNPEQWRQYYVGETTDAGKIVVAPLFDDGQHATNQDGKPLYYVVSGNGRANALGNAYDTGRSSLYDKGIRGAMRADGINPDGLLRPVAVVVWKPDSLDHAVRIAELSNRSAQLSKTSLESALRDAAAIGDKRLLALWQPSETGDAAAASNRPFWVAFAAAVGEDGLIQSDGRPSEIAATRVQNALLAMILGDSKPARATLKKVLERADALGIRRQVAGIVAEAGAILDLRDASPEYDVAPMLAEALESVVRFKEARQSGQVANVDEWFAQGDLFAEGNKVASDLARAIVETPTTSGIRDMLAEYRRRAQAIDTSTGDLFGAAPPTRDELIRQAIDARPLDAALDEFTEEFGEGHPVAAKFAPASALWSQMSPKSRRHIARALQYEADRLRSGVPTALEFQRGMASQLDPEAAAVQRFIDSIDADEAPARWQKVYSMAGKGRDVGMFLRKQLEQGSKKTRAELQPAATGDLRGSRNNNDDGALTPQPDPVEYDRERGEYDIREAKLDLSQRGSGVGAAAGGSGDGRDFAAAASHVRASLRQLPRRPEGGGGGQGASLDPSGLILRDGLGHSLAKKIAKEEKRALRRWAEESGMVLPWEAFSAPWGKENLRHKERHGGVEHDVYYDAGSGRWFKRVTENPMHERWHDYLQRMELHAELFPGTAYRLEGVLWDDRTGRFGLLVSQPDAAGDFDVSPEEIREFMAEQRFVHVPVARTDRERVLDGGQPDGPRYDDHAFYNAEHGVWVRDLHERNVLRRPSGGISVIDPVIEVARPGTNPGFRAHRRGLPVPLAPPNPSPVATLPLGDQPSLFTDAPIEPGPIFGRHEKRKAAQLERLKYVRALAADPEVDKKRRAFLNKAAKTLAVELDGGQGLLFDAADMIGSKDPDIDQFLSNLADWQRSPKVAPRRRRGQDTATPELPGMGVDGSPQRIEPQRLGGSVPQAELQASAESDEDLNAAIEEAKEAGVTYPHERDGAFRSKWKVKAAGRRVKLKDGTIRTVAKIDDKTLILDDGTTTTEKEVMAELSATELELEPYFIRRYTAYSKMLDGFNEKIRQIAGGLPDAHPILAPLKGAPRALEKSAKKLVESRAAKKAKKVEFALTPEEIINDLHDILRASVLVDSQDHVKAANAAILRTFAQGAALVETKPNGEQVWEADGVTIILGDRFESPTEAGYSDVQMKVEVAPGMFAELQVHIPEMLAAKEGNEVKEMRVPEKYWPENLSIPGFDPARPGHKLYEEARALPDGDPRKDELNRQMAALYRAAIKSHEARIASKNSSRESLLTQGSSPPGGGPGTSTLPAGPAINGLPASTATGSPSSFNQNEASGPNSSGSNLGSSLTPQSTQSGGEEQADLDLFAQAGVSSSDGEPAPARGQGDGAEPSPGDGGDPDAAGVAQRPGGDAGQPADGGQAELDFQSAGGRPAAGGGRAGAAGDADGGGVGRDTERSPQGQRDGDGGGVDGTGDAVPGGRGGATSQGQAEGGGDGVGGRRRGKRREVDREERQRPPVGSPDRNHEIEEGDTLAPRGAKTKARANIDAIHLLRQLEAEGRNPTPAEKRTLAQYVGWGGIPQVFDETKGDEARRKIEQEILDWRGMSRRYPGSATYYEQKVDEERQKLTSIENWQKQWGGLQEELRGLLTDEEWKAARNSTINAHYTSAKVIRLMWQAIERLGFKGGRALEPAGGIGHFIGLTPESLRDDTTWNSVELDSLSSRILKKLYPEAAVEVATGFEKSKVPDNSMDLVVSNVPFDSSGPYDPAMKAAGAPRLNLHNYFFAKALRKVRPGGLVAFITSAHTMDSSGDQRRWLATQGEFLGAIRLPNDAFRENAGTDVVTDIIFLRKPVDGKVKPVEGVKSWTGTEPVRVQGGQVTVNSYFAANPGMIVGRMDNDGSMYANREGEDGEMTVHPMGDLGEQMAGAISYLPEGAITDAGTSADWNPSPAPEVFDGGKMGAFGLDADGGLTITGATPEEVESHPLAKVSKRPFLKDYLTLRESLNSLYEVESNPDASEAEVEQARRKLNDDYDWFIKRHKLLHKHKNLLSGDPDYYRTLGLEVEVDAEDTFEGAIVGTLRKKQFRKADVFTKRVLTPRREPTTAESLDDALGISLGWRGRLDVGFMADLIGSDIDTVSEQLIADGRAFADPATGLLTEQSEYLSGNVRRKLAQAREAAKLDPDLRRNVEALEQVQPPDVPMADITFHLGSQWLPAEVVGQFASDVFGGEVSVRYIAPAGRGDAQTTGTWLVDAPGFVRSGSAANVTFAVKSERGGTLKDGLQLLEETLNVSDPQIWQKTEDGSRKIDMEKTSEARGVVERLNERFQQWVVATSSAQKALETTYNEQFNSHVLAKYDGSHLPMPWVSKQFELYPSKKHVVWRALKQGNLLVAHGVGGGKTLIGTGIALEAKRLGMANKPLIVVHNATLEQFAETIGQVAPTARVLVAHKKDLEGARRKEFMAKVRSGDWDAVVMAQSSFNMIPDDPDVERAIIDEMIDELNEARVAAQEESGAKDPTVKELVKQIKKLEARLAKLADRKVDDVLTFQELGVDMMIVDEVHAYKKMPFVTKLARVAGVDTGFSKNGHNLRMRARWVQEKNGGTGVISMTGTPVTNTLGESWNMVRLVRPDLLEEYGIRTFDQFVSAFAKREQSYELRPNGEYKAVDRLAQIVNLPEWNRFFRTAADVKLGDKMDVRGRPKIAGGKAELRAVPKTSLMGEFVGWVTDLLERYDQMSGEEKASNKAIPLLTYNASRAAAIDVRLVDPGAQDEEGSKANQAVREVLRMWGETGDYSGTQVIFADSYQNMRPEFLDLPKLGDSRTGETEFDLYRDLKRKLVAGGIPAEQIAIIKDFKNDAAKDKLFQAVNAGRVRVIIGSTQTLGTGVNMQERMIAAHHLDVPWTPAEIEQRDGRVFRQGNIHAEMDKPVHLIRYGMEDTLDAALWQKLETKERFTKQALSGETSSRTIEDDTALLSFSEQKAVLSGELGLRKFQADERVKKLSLEQRSFITRQMAARQTIAQAETSIRQAEGELARARELADMLAPWRGLEDTPLEIAVDGQKFESVDKLKKHLAGLMAARNEAANSVANPLTAESLKRPLATVSARGAEAVIEWAGTRETIADSKAPWFVDYKLRLGDRVLGGRTISEPGWVLRTMYDAQEAAADRIGLVEGRIKSAKATAEAAQVEADQQFEKQAELDAALAEQAAVNAELGIGGKKKPEAKGKLPSPPLPADGKRQPPVSAAEMVTAAALYLGDNGTPENVIREQSETIGRTLYGLGLASERAGEYAQLDLFGDEKPEPEKKLAARTAAAAAKAARKARAEAPSDDLVRGLSGDWAALAREVAARGRASSLIPSLVRREIPTWNIVGTKIEGPEDVHAVMLPLRSPYFESLKMMVLDGNNDVVYSKILFVGALAESVAHPGEIMGELARLREESGKNYTRIILSHNHPSGDPNPSGADVRLTRNLDELATLAGWEVVDHVVTDGDSHYSFREAGTLTSRAPSRGYKPRQSAGVAPGPIRAEDRQAGWEVVGRGVLRMVDRQDIAAEVARYLRTGNKSAYLLYLTTRMTLTAVEVVPEKAQTAKDIARLIVAARSREGAAAVMLVLPDGVSGESRVGRNLHNAVHSAAELGMMRHLDTLWTEEGRWHSDIGGLVKEEGGEYGREPSSTLHLGQYLEEAGKPFEALPPDRRAEMVEAANAAVAEASARIEAEGRIKEDGTILAPNGKPSTLYRTLLDEAGDADEAQRLYAMVHTPFFKRWFGDWESGNPETVSKVVDENGEPLVVWHGTDAEFDVFDVPERGAERGLIFFSKKPRTYGRNVSPYYLRGQMRVVPDSGRSRDRREVDGRVMFDDGAFADETVTYEGRDTLYVGSPNQIKSATANQGTFSESDSIASALYLGEDSDARHAAHLGGPQSPGNYPDRIATVIRSTKVRPLTKSSLKPGESLVPLLPDPWKPGQKIDLTPVSPDYRDAKKNGDGAAAARVVTSALKPKALEELRSALAGVENPRFVPVRHRDVGPRHNALPPAYARSLTDEIGGVLDMDIYKASGNALTNVGVKERFNTAQEFDGPVVAGGQYVVVDDTFTSGNTITALISHIHRGGGEVIAVTTLADSQSHNYLRPRPKDVDKLVARAGGDRVLLERELGFPIEALTGSEIYRLANLDRGWAGAAALSGRFQDRRGVLAERGEADRRRGDSRVRPDQSSQEGLTLAPSSDSIARTLDLSQFGPRRPEGEGEAPASPPPLGQSPNALYKAMGESMRERPAAWGADQRARDRQERMDKTLDRAGLERKRVGGRPDLSGVVVEQDDQGVRDEFDFTDEARKAMANQESVQLWVDEGRKLVADDPGGVERRLLRSALNADDVSIRAEDVMAARILVERRTREALASGDREALERAGMLRHAYRETRADTARALAAGRDLFRTPAERHRSYLADALLRLPPRIVREIDRKFPFPEQAPVSEQREAVDAKRVAVERAIKDRLAKIEGELGKMGVTLEEIFAGEAYLRLRSAPILQAALQPLTPAEQTAIKLVQEAVPMKRIQKLTGLSAAQIEAARMRVRSALEAKLRAKVRAGARLEDIDIAGAIAMTLPLSPAATAALTDQDIEAELRRILDVGFGLGENHKTNVSGFHTPKAKPKKKPRRPDPVGDLAHDVPWDRPGFDTRMNWRFDIRDRAHVMQLSRAIVAMDGDWIDTMAEWYYNAILSGPHTQAVNVAGTAIYSTWNASVGRGFEILLNSALKSKEAATLGEYRYVVSALKPHLKRALSNAYAAFMAETPFFEEDILNQEMDVAQWGQEDRGIYRVGFIKGEKGRWFRLATRGLLAMDEFFKAWVAGLEVGGMAYRLGLKRGYKADSPQMQQWIRQQLNLPGSAAWQMAATKAYEATFTTRLPSTFQDVRSIGDMMAQGAGALTSFLTPQSGDSGLAKLTKMLGRLFFFPFQRTPFNIIRTAGRHVPNPVTGLDLGWNIAKNLRLRNGKFVWDGDHHSEALAVEMAAKQLQGLVFLLFLMGIGEGDEDDLEQWLIVTGSKPRTGTKRGERDLAYRMGLGPYSISMRLPGGGRVTASYQRFDPVATVLGTLTDATKEVKHVLAGRRTAGDATGVFVGSLVDQMSDKTFLQGFGEIVAMAKGERNMSQWAAGRMASFIPNLFRQPLRQTDDFFRERPDGFLGELLYQAAPTGLNPAAPPPRRDIYGETADKGANPLVRLLDISRAAGHSEPQPWDVMAYHWNREHPDEVIAKQDPSPLFTDPETGERKRMSPAQFARYKEVAGKRAVVRLRQETFNIQRPTRADIDRFESAVDAARADARKILYQSAAWRNL